MSGEALRSKFRDCLKRRVTSGNIDRAIEILAAFGELPDVGKLIRALVPATKAQRH
jgi:hypothetical protein